VRLPNDREKGGFLELCNHHIAIVTLLDRQAGHPLDMEHLAGFPSEDDEMLAAGRAFESGCFMAAKVKLATYGEEGQFYPSRLDLDLPISEKRLSLWKPVSSYEGRPVVRCRYYTLLFGMIGKHGTVIAFYSSSYMCAS
jgi:hypothetical protein